MLISNIQIVQQLNEQIRKPSKKLNHLGPKGVWRHTELEVIQAIIKLGVASSRDIGREIGLSHKWVEDKTRLLKSAGRIYISDWKRYSTRGPPREMFSIRSAGEEDEPRPAAMSGSEKTKSYRSRKKFKELLNDFSGK